MSTVKEFVQKNSRTKKKKSAIREWFDSVAFAVIAATIIRWLFFSAFVIPTSSMENTLLVGDYLFVSKLHYGTTTPVTPLQIPLSHQTFWGTSIPSYLNWIRLPSFRLPGFSGVKRGDVVVFNLPVEDPALYQKYSSVLPNLKPHPVDLRTNYIKRCVAQAGDLFEIREGQVYINGKASENPLRMQNEYFVTTNGPVNENNIFRKNGVSEFSAYTETFGDTIAGNDAFGYILYTTKAIAAKIKSYDFVKNVTSVYLNKNKKEPFLYPVSDLVSWNKDNYGPVRIPAKGQTIELTPVNIALFNEVIRYYEGNENITFDSKGISQKGQLLKTYTFRQDYYFMIGDNRHQSADSRYWGLVPKDHIVGKAVFVWMSIDPDPVRFINKLRWNRIFRVIE
jgi:signal peptidase I